MTDNSTAAVAARHADAYARGDVDALLADYAEDAVIVTSMAGNTVGRAAIREMFTGLFRDALPADSRVVEFAGTFVEGEIALLLWSARSANVRIDHGVDTLVVRDGKIVGQSGAGVVSAPGA